MKHTFLFSVIALVTLSAPILAQEEPERSSNEAVAQTETPHPSPNAIVEAADASEWVSIPAEDLVVMTLDPAADGSERKVIIQLMPAPFSQGWVNNIRTLARAKWYDGITVNRVQDNYVVQWGDPGHDNPETGETETKPLPEGLKVMGEDEYAATGLLSIPDPRGRPRFNYTLGMFMMRNAMIAAQNEIVTSEEDIAALEAGDVEKLEPPEMPDLSDRYASMSSLTMGWPIAAEMNNGGTGNRFWPVHCYGMVGVGRDYSPDTGSGAELYTVIGHAPRHLDRNIALVGRIISGMEHLSSLPRGSGTLGFYTEEEKDKRTPIVSVRVASDLPLHDQPAFDYLSTESETFARYAEARANRRDPFFIVPAGGADICNIPVPVREMAHAEGS